MSTALSKQVADLGFESRQLDSQFVLNPICCSGANSENIRC